MNSPTFLRLREPTRRREATATWFESYVAGPRFQGVGISKGEYPPWGLFGGGASPRSDRRGESLSVDARAIADTQQGHPKGHAWLLIILVGCTAWVLGLAGCSSEDCPETCTSPSICVAGACRVPCQVGTDCAVDEVCFLNLCENGDPPATLCGDGTCDTGENGCNCVQDCTPGGCGDGICCAATHETAADCAVDCGPTTTCGNGTCDALTENAITCPADCAGGTCGDGICGNASNENATSCPADCAVVACGDATCAASEAIGGCVADCGGCTNNCTQCGGANCCLASCGGTGADCSLSCGCATCGFDCQNANNCEVACSGTQDCAIDCRGNSTNNCENVTCSGGAKCLLYCGTANNCLIDCDGTALNCPSNVKACNRPCP